MKHYFIANDEQLDIKTITDYVAGKEYQLLSANGVFSKDKIDYGSKILLEYLIANKDLKGKLVDIGSGIGTLALILAQNFSEIKGDLYDVNNNAVQLARENIKKNALEQRLVANTLDVNQIDIEIKEQYDFAITNPPIRAGKQTVFNCYNFAFNSLKTGGELYVVIQKKQGANSSKKYLAELFDTAEIVHKKAGYNIIKANK